MADASEMIQELDPYYLANNYTSQSVSQKYQRYKREKSAYAIRNLTGENVHYSLDRFALTSRSQSLKKDSLLILEENKEEQIGSLQIEIPAK